MVSAESLERRRRALKLAAKKREKTYNVPSDPQLENLDQ